MRKNILQAVEPNTEFLLGRIVKAIISQSESTVKMDPGSGDAGVFHAGRAAVVMALNVANFTHRAGYAKFGAIPWIVIVGLADIDIITHRRHSAGLLFAEAEFHGNVVGAEIFITPR
jgi:hypothetical protein